MTLDRAVGAALLLTALVVLNDLRQNSHLIYWDQRYGPGPSFFPFWLAAISLALSVPFLLSGARVGSPGWGVSRGSTIKFMILMLGLAALFPRLGGVASLSAFVMAELLWIERASPRRALLAGVVTIVVTRLLFVQVLHVRFPVGPLGF